MMKSGKNMVRVSWVSLDRVGSRQLLPCLRAALHSYQDSTGDWPHCAPQKEEDFCLNHTLSWSVTLEEHCSSLLVSVSLKLACACGSSLGSEAPSLACLSLSSDGLRPPFIRGLAGTKVCSSSLRAFCLHHLAWRNGSDWRNQSGDECQV